MSAVWRRTGELVVQGVPFREAMAEARMDYDPSYRDQRVTELAREIAIAMPRPAADIAEAIRSIVNDVNRLTDLERGALEARIRDMRHGA